MFIMSDVNSAFLMIALGYTIFWLYQFSQGRVLSKVNSWSKWQKFGYVYKKNDAFGFWTGVFIVNIPISIILFLFAFNILTLRV